MTNMEYSYLRPKKAAWLKRMYAAPFTCHRELSLWQGQNASILPRRYIPSDHFADGRGGVVDKDGQYVALSANAERLQKSYPFQDSVYHDEKVVYCGYLFKHWGHFLVESVTRLWYVLENDPSIDKYVFFLDENEERTVAGNHRAFFELLKIWDKVEFINTPTTYREVLVPEMAFACMQYYSPKYIAIFDFIAENITVDPVWPHLDKIYFSRSQFAKGTGYEFGLDSMDHFFSKNGFTVLAPEKVPLAEMIYHIRNASAVASISGTLPHNMLFGKDGQKLIVIERLIINVDYQVSINQMRHLDATHIDANFALYTIDTTGPYMLGCNHILERYIVDHNLLPPDEKYSSKKYRDKCFKQYMKSYQDNYRYRWHKESWYPEIADSLWEAYDDTYPYFRDYIDGNKPCLPEHYFQLHYWKQWIKRILRKNK